MKKFSGNLSAALLFFLLLTLSTPRLPAADGSKAEKRGNLSEKIADAESVIWSRFYSPETNLFYDYITSYEPGKELAHLPAADEVARLDPNINGYGTGMEDCMISAGVIISAILDEYAVTQNPALREKVSAVIRGIDRCLSIYPGEGFVARGISPSAPDKSYIGTSRDQVTHAVAGLWEYYRSPLCRDDEKERIRFLLKSVADRMIRNVTPENDYDFLNADGTRCTIGICKMEQVQTHEAARLAMIYAIASDVAGEEIYHRLWREKIAQAAADSLGELFSITTYGLLQMQLSLSVLDTLEPDPAIRETLEEAASRVSREARSRQKRCREQTQTLDLTETAPDWREAGGLVDPYRRTWYNIRERGELSLILLYDPNPDFTPDDAEFLADILERVDFFHVSTCGIYDLAAAYYKARRLGRME